MKIKLAALAALSTLALAACETGPAYGPPPPGPPLAGPPPMAQAPIPERIENLRTRIRAGQADGSLAPGEARRVLDELNDIQGQAQRMRGNDGRIGPAERRVLDQRLDQLSRSVRWLKHN